MVFFPFISVSIMFTQHRLTPNLSLPRHPFLQTSSLLDIHLTMRHRRRKIFKIYSVTQLGCDQAVQVVSSVRAILP